jgi:hypothetical protein
MASGPFFVSPHAQPQDIAGLSIPGAILSFFLTGSDTPVTVYANETLTTPLGTTVTADATGTFAVIYLDPTKTYKVKLTGPDDGITAPTEYWTVDPYILPWPVTQTVYFDKTYEFLGSAPQTAEVVGMYTAVRPQRFYGNFDGTSVGQAKANGVWLDAPTAETIVQCYLNNATLVGYMRIKTTLVVDFFTDGGNPFDMDADEYLVWKVVAADATLGRGTWTTPGVNL